MGYIISKNLYIFIYCLYISERYFKTLIYKNWSPALNTTKLLLSICSLLEEPIQNYQQVHQLLRTIKRFIMQMLANTL
jgi:ubiquitin-protein ligase